jgi:hypothetical protein
MWSIGSGMFLIIVLVSMLIAMDEMFFDLEIMTAGNQIPDIRHSSDRWIKFGTS